jgi:hypothetical protein
MFSTIHAILLNEEAKMNHSCIWFSIIGAFVLREHYKINAKVAMGIAAYMVDEEKENVLVFAENDGTRLFCSDNGFHSWIEANEHIIDFTAPLFPKMVKSVNPTESCPSKMFQKPLKKMCNSVSELKRTGDFFVGKDMVFSDQTVDHFMSFPVNVDLIKLCCDWYKRPPKKMYKAIKIGNNKGHLNDVHLKQINLVGSW